MRHDELPPELRGTPTETTRRTGAPLWTQLTALVLIVSLLGFFVISYFA
ncbi:hypothetical protein [Nocardioides limicola]|nr:hypothetical protein [Nocardioides sp. DJM-14]